MNSRLHTQIGEIFSQHLHLDVASPATDLFETGLLDSLGFVEILVQLEEMFGIRVSMQELTIDTFRSIEKIAEFVSTRADHLTIV